MSRANNVALLINRNARRVNDRVLSRMQDWLPAHQVYATHSQEEAAAAVRDILDRGYENVFAGGGDGTFVDLVNTLHREAGDRRWPRLGVLRLGTGNAVAQLVSTGAPEQDLQAFLTQETRDDLAISMVEDDDGVLFPFGGLGLDAQILNDYDHMQARLGSSFVGPLFKNVVGYFVAGIFRTVPRLLRNRLARRKVHMRVTSNGDQAFLLGRNGVVERYFGRGEVIYDGPFTLMAAGTSPYYGYGMKMLPYANRYPSMFHLRMAHVGVARTFMIMPGVWKGTYQGKELTDFAVESVKVELSGPTPYQIAGDAGGERTELSLRCNPQPVRLIRLI